MVVLPTKDQLLSILARAIHTFAQALLAFITIGMTLTELDWKHALSVAAMAAIYSILKSIVIGTPETKTAGTLVITEYPEGKANWSFEVDQPLEDIEKSNIIRLKVNNTKES